uniref:Ionotropic receptor 1 n=1 Tax=Apriona germarii TaxID=157307 RepID=A0A7H9SNX8_APRGE|nr:ionotropic receptor 1 [Apriona germarii]
MRKLYKTRINSSINIEEMGFWTKNQGYSDYGFEKNTARRRGNLKGTKLNTCLVITNKDTLNHLTDKKDKHIDSITKVNYVLVEHLKDVVNATLNYTVQSTWGYKNERSSWSGMMGELVRNEVDIGGTPLFFTIDRVDIIDYIAMTTPTRSKFIFRQPTLSYVTNIYTLPFDDYVWLSSIFLVVVVGFFLYITIKWEWKKAKYEKIDEEPYPELRDSVADVAILSLGAVCQQGAAAIPFSVPGRITTIMLFISLMFLYTSYSACIVALLQSSSNSIQTLEDLLKSRLQIGVDDTVFSRFYFTNETEPIRRALYLQKVAPPGKKNNFMSIEEGVRKLKEGLFAFHMETGPGYKIIAEVFREEEKCGLQEIQFLQVTDPWLAIQKNSSYKELLKIGLRKIQETGLQSREVGLIYTKKPICTSRGSSFVSVGIVDSYPAALVLAWGLMAAVAVFAAEIYIYYRKNFLLNIKRHFFGDTKIEPSKEKSDLWPYLN